jgi:pyridoxal phosphate enzyme (YggS family)
LHLLVSEKSKAVMSDSSDIARNLADVKAAIARAAAKAARSANDVALVAVSKGHDASAAAACLAAGQRLFGENRVQEAEAKWPALKDRYRDARLHLIGPLQTNKAAAAIRLFDAIETVDRPRLAETLSRHMAEQGRRVDCFVQVNTGNEPQKAGIAPAEADAFVRACRNEYKLPLVGLMCIPPVDEEPSLHFALLREIAKRNDLTQLSMGMSADYEIAVEFGATFVRVGTAIFGHREYPAAG